MPSEKKITFDALGVCNLMDLFYLCPNEHFNVKKFFQLSFVPQFDKSPLFEINPLKPEEFEGRINFFRKMTAADINRTILPDLSNSGAEWIIIDVRQLAYGLKKLEFGGEIHYCSDRDVSKSNAEKAVKAKNLKLDSFTHVEFDEVPNAEQYHDFFCDFLKNRYGKNIILIELKEALWTLHKDGTVSYEDNEILERYCRTTDYWFYKTLEKLDCYYVKTPPNILWDEHHVWSYELVHYVQEWYDYANKCVELITSGDPDYLKKTDRLYIKLTNFFDNLRGKCILSRRNTWRRFEENIKSAKTKEETDAVITGTLEKMNMCEELTQGELYGRIARVYRDRKDGYADLDKSAEYMRKAMELKCEFAIVELFDLLWEINTPDSLLEMINLAYNTTKSGTNIAMMSRLGRAYLEGKGVSKDLNTAAKWMKLCADQNCEGAKIEYYDILWRINTPESLKTMVEYGQAESDKGNMELRARLAGAYRDGKGVEKDLKKAAEIMKTVLSGDPVWAKWEYIDILERMNTPEADIEAYEYAKSIVSLGKEIEALIGRMYRDGRGVQADLNTAADWMRKASDKKLDWAQLELFDILWRIDTPESLKEMIDLAESVVATDNPEMQGRLGRAYREGKGVEKDLQKASEWMKKAADKNLPWAIKELAEINNEIAVQHATESDI